MGTIIVRYLAIPALVVLLSTTGHADDLDWRYDATLYAWTAGMDGKVSHNGLPTFHVSQGFRDVWSNLDVGGMAAFEARKGRFGYFFDALYVSLSDTARVPVLDLRGKVEGRATSALLAVQYRLHETDRAHLDILGGVRYWSFSTRLSLSIPPEIPIPPQLSIPREISEREGVRYAVPKIGLKGTWSFDNPLYVSGWAIGGALGKSNYGIDLMAALGYEFTDRTSMLLGYRWFSVRYESSGSQYDVTLHGPGLGLNWRF